MFNGPQLDNDGDVSLAGCGSVTLVIWVPGYFAGAADSNLDSKSRVWGTTEGLGF